jgi:hypothetical protein
MRSTHAAILICLLAICLLASTPGRAASGTIDRAYDESFEVAPGDRLVLRHDDGDVRISAWERDTLEVRVVYRAEYSVGGLGTSSERDFTVDFERSGSDVRVTGRESGGGGVRIGWSTMKVHEHLYTVRAPSWLELELRGEDGDVELADWTGATSLRLEDGDVVVDRFSGRLEVVLEDGDLTLRESVLEESRFDLEDGDVDFGTVAGTFRLATEDGDVTARALAAHHVFIQSVDGDVTLQVEPGGPLDLEVRTADGNAQVELAAGVSTRFEVATGDGDVRIDLPGALDLEESAHAARGSVGTGVGRLLVRTDDGRASLRAGD